MKHAQIAAVESDQAKVALACAALDDLEALAILAVQRGLLDVDSTERVFCALGQVGAGLRSARKWMRAVRYGEIEVTG